MRNTKILFIFILFIGGWWLFFTPLYTVPIITYHAIPTNFADTSFKVTLTRFYRQMEFIKNKGYKVISLSDYCQLLRRKEKLPKNLVVITFDDGYKDNLWAVNILKQFNFPATIFLIPNKIDKKNYLSSKDIEWFLNNTKVKIGSHTLTHSYLPQLDDASLIREIKDSKEILEKKFRVNVDTIAYPLGGFDHRVLKTVEGCGYICGVTTNRGLSKNDNIYALKRIKISERDLGIRLWAKLSGFYSVFKRSPKQR
ncbi:MAG: polysaccharide deacetylase family protein [Candidatus Omnitrophica bacterium]|nr:polysaccharide deacetylase family protein [Candidatus Omnitrophota bacterium]